MDIKEPVGSFLKRLPSSLEGNVLIITWLAYLVLALAPTIAIQTFGARDCLASEQDARTVFLVMLVVLPAEYFWFALSARNAKNGYVTAAILIATALIPVVRLNYYRFP